MIDAHGTLGVLLVVLYAAIAILAFILASRRGNEAGRLPSWLTGTAHALLAVQIVLGVILIMRYPHAVPASHAVAGLAALAALGLIVPLRRRFGRLRGLGAAALVVALLAATAATIALSR